MNSALTLPALAPLMPEIVLGVGAMALLMIGAYRGERSARLTDVLSILLLIAAGVLVVLQPQGKLVTFGGSFIVDDFARFLKVLALTGSAAAILMSIDYAKREHEAAVRISGADRTLDARHADADFGGRSDRALSRARADEPAALCGRREPPLVAALERGRARNISCSARCRRACCCTAPR